MSDYLLLQRKTRIARRVKHESKAELKTSTIGNLLRHPLFTLVVGFILTGLIGSYISQRYQERAKAQEREITEQRQQYELGIRSLEDATTLIYSRRTRAALLFSSLQRSAPIEELTQRKRDYDASFFDMNSKLQTTLFGIRRATGSESYSRFENLYETTLRKPFALLDECITDAVDVAVKVKRKSTYATCNITDLLSASLNCSYVWSDEFYKLVSSDRRGLTEIERNSKVANAEARVRERCVVPPGLVIRELYGGNSLKKLPLSN